MTRSYAASLVVAVGLLLAMAPLAPITSGGATLMRFDVAAPSGVQMWLTPSVDGASVRARIHYRCGDARLGTTRENFSSTFRVTCMVVRARTDNVVYVGGQDNKTGEAIIERWAFTDPEPRVEGGQSVLSTEFERTTVARIDDLSLVDLAVNPFGVHDRFVLLTRRGEVHTLVEYDAQEKTLADLAPSTPEIREVLSRTYNLTTWFAPKEGLHVLTVPPDGPISKPPYDALVLVDADTDGAFDTHRIADFGDMSELKTDRWFRVPRRPEHSTER